LEVEEVESVPVSFYYRSAAYAEEQIYTVLVVRETAFAREIERLDAWLLEVAAYLKNHTGRFRNLSSRKHEILERSTAAKKSQRLATKQRTSKAGRRPPE